MFLKRLTDRIPPISVVPTTVVMTPSGAEPMTRSSWDLYVKDS